MLSASTHWPWSPEMWAAGKPQPGAEPPVDCTHPKYQLIWVTASQGSILELCRQVCTELEGDTASFFRAALTNFIRKQVLEVAQDRKKKPSSSSIKPPSSNFKSWPSFAHQHLVSGRLQANPALHPSRPEQPRQPPHIQHLPSPSLQGRGQKPPGQRLPPGHAGLPPAPPQNRRRQTEPLL
ncbi:hypothetical protein DFAR_1280002 [Desulfarculales bacterium]